MHNCVLLHHWVWNTLPLWGQITTTKLALGNSQNDPWLPPLVANFDHMQNMWGDMETEWVMFQAGFAGLLLRCWGGCLTEQCASIRITDEPRALQSSLLLRQKLQTFNQPCRNQPPSVSGRFMTGRSRRLRRAGGGGRNTPKISPWLTFQHRGRAWGFRGSVGWGGSCRIHYFDPSQTNRKLTKMLIIGPWDQKNPPWLKYTEFKSLLHN